MKIVAWNIDHKTREKKIPDHSENSRARLQQGLEDQTGMLGLDPPDGEGCARSSLRHDRGLETRWPLPLFRQ
jgi:hypothetical protein